MLLLAGKLEANQFSNIQSSYLQNGTMVRGGASDGYGGGDAMEKTKALLQFADGMYNTCCKPAPVDESQWWTKRTCGTRCESAQVACIGAGFTWRVEGVGEEGTRHCTCNSCTAGQEQAKCELPAGCKRDGGDDFICNSVFNRVLSNGELRALFKKQVRTSYGTV